MLVFENKEPTDCYHISLPLLGMIIMLEEIIPEIRFLLRYTESDLSLTPGCLFYKGLVNFLFNISLTALRTTNNNLKPQKSSGLVSFTVESKNSSLNLIIIQRDFLEHELL